MINNGKQADNAIKATHQYNLNYCLRAVAEAGGQKALGIKIGMSQQTVNSILSKGSFMPVNRLRKKIEETLK